MADANKVKFGLKNCHYSVITESGGTITYGTPVAIKGAVNLSIDAQGEETVFAADNNAKYWVASNNSGYSGELEVAKLPESFYTDVLGYLVDNNGNVFEDATVEYKKFALLFEFDGDTNKTRHILYYCSTSRPTLASNTTSETREPVTDTLPITASPLPEDANGHQFVKASCVEGDTSYSTWFSAVTVYVPIP